MCKSRPLLNPDPCLLKNRGSEALFLDDRFQVSVLRGNEVTHSNYMEVEDLDVYKKLCRSET